VFERTAAAFAEARPMLVTESVLFFCEGLPSKKLNYREVEIRGVFSDAII